MFRIEAFCDDKNLSRVLHALMGIVHGQPAIQPVANGKVVKGRAQGANNGDICEMFAAYAKKQKLATFGASELKAFAQSIGRAESGYGYIRNDLFKCGVIRKIGKGTTMKYAIKTAVKK